MDRILQNTAGSIGVEVYVADTLTDPSPDSATVQIDRADGTNLVPAGTSAINVGTGEFAYNLTPAQTALLDRLTAYWTVTLSGQVQTLKTRHEIAGEFLVSAAALRADSALEDQAAYPDKVLTALRAKAERALEQACGVAFVPRYEYERVYAPEGDWLPVRWRRVRAVRTLDGAASTASLRGGAIRWTSSYDAADVTIGYEHGHDFPPPETDRVVGRLVRHYAIDSPLDDRALRLDADNGSWVMATPGQRGQHFGIPEVDAFVEARGYKKPGFSTLSVTP